MTRRILLLAAAAAAVYAMVCADVVLRARSACREGERYMEWHRRPELKKAFYEAEFERAKSALDAEKSAGRMGDPEYRQRLRLERFRADEAVAESSAKLAYHWFKTAVELFTPPESRWVRRSRAGMVEARSLWVAELRERKIPFEDYMLE